MARCFALAQQRQITVQMSLVPTADGYFGCLDADGNGVADLFEQNQTDDTGDSMEQITQPDQFNTRF